MDELQQKARQALLAKIAEKAGEVSGPEAVLNLARAYALVAGTDERKVSAYEDHDLVVI